MHGAQMGGGGHHDIFSEMMGGGSPFGGMGPGVSFSFSSSGPSGARVFTSFGGG
tara:strand:- start:207 stop:368 length:162 start_codon:yes stop_codon:yes gene_type:complete